MANIILNDLNGTQELDRKTMTLTRGGVGVPFGPGHPGKGKGLGKRRSSVVSFLEISNVENNGNVLSLIANGSGNKQSIKFLPHSEVTVILG